MTVFIINAFSKKGPTALTKETNPEMKKRMSPEYAAPPSPNGI